MPFRRVRFRTNVRNPCSSTDEGASCSSSLNHSVIENSIFMILFRIISIYLDCYMNLTNSEIAKQIANQLQHRELTVEKCCKAFNLRHSDEISVNSIRPMNKDFLSRVKRGSFKVCSPRILKLCEFLEIGVGDSQETEDPLCALSREIQEFKKFSDGDSDLEKQFPAIGKFLSGLNLDQMFHGN